MTKNECLLRDALTELLFVVDRYTVVGSQQNSSICSITQTEERCKDVLRVTATDCAQISIVHY